LGEIEHLDALENVPALHGCFPGVGVIGCPNATARPCDTSIGVRADLAGAPASVIMPRPANWAADRAVVRADSASFPSSVRSGVVMDFAYSDKVRELQLRVQQFMDTHITPNEEVYYQQVEAGGRWCVPPILDALKAKAKQEGLWNLFL